MKKVFIVLVTLSVFSVGVFAGGVGVLPHPPPTEKHTYVYKKAITDKGDTIKVVIIDDNLPKKVEPFFKNDGEKLMFIYGFLTPITICIGWFILRAIVG